MAKGRRGKGSRNKGAWARRESANDYPSVLNKTVLDNLQVVPRAGVEKLAENIAGCIDKNVITAVLNGVPASPSGINRAIRESVLEGVAASDIHRTWLAELDRIAQNTTSLPALQRAIHAYVRQAGMERVDDLKRAELYRVTGRTKEGVREVVNPAYIDSTDGRLILTGHLRFVAPTAGSPAAETAMEEEAESKGQGSSGELRD